MASLSLLKALRANLKKPDHTGALEESDGPGSECGFRPMPLSRNKCACALHKLHRRVARAIAKEAGR